MNRSDEILVCVYKLWSELDYHYVMLVVLPEPFVGMEALGTLRKYNSQATLPRTESEVREKVES